jgi:hypothetical protein
MVIAATTFALAAFCIADDSRLVSPPPRAAAAIVVRIFIPGPADGCDMFSRGLREK